MSDQFKMNPGEIHELTKDQVTAKIKEIKDNLFNEDGSINGDAVRLSGKLSDRMQQIEHEEFEAKLIANAERRKKKAKDEAKIRAEWKRSGRPAL